MDLLQQLPGVMKDIPENSQVKGDVIISMTTLTQKLAPKIEEQWGNFGAATFLLLKPGASPKGLEAKFLHSSKNAMAGNEAKQDVLQFIS